MDLQGWGLSAQCKLVHSRSYLSTFTIVFILAGELLVLKSIQYLPDGLGWFCKHGLEGYSWGELAFLTKTTDAKLEEGRDDQIIGWKFTVDRQTL